MAAATAERRNPRGTPLGQLYNWPDVSPDDSSGPLAIQAYLQQLIRKDPNDLKSIVGRPEAFDRLCWLYEHLRQVCLQLSELIVELGEACNSTTCPVMNATAGVTYLCAAHKQNLECCAIDYIVHTLDWSIHQLCVEANFPSRLEIKPSALEIMKNVARRLYRMFAHAYFHHRAIFDSFETQTRLCGRFTALCQANDLQESKLYLIDPAALKR